jgi:hypothetical protein
LEDANRLWTPWDEKILQNKIKIDLNFEDANKLWTSWNEKILQNKIKIN